MEQPSRLFLRQASRLFSEQSDQQQFIDAFIHPPELKTALLWTKDIPSTLSFEIEPISHPSFTFTTLTSGSPGKDSLHQEGFYYCFDYSSLFAAGVLSAV